ncbi:MAG: DNA polymerase V [Arenicella sp.]|jgi:DNA polymerase V
MSIKPSSKTYNPGHGGARQGAGRPKGSGRYNEPTVAIRVPGGSIPQIKDYLSVYPDVSDSIVNYTAPATADNIVKLEIPLFSSSVAAGFPSPAEDHIEDTLDLNDYMVERPDSTFMLRVEGESMKDIGILPNDILVVDRSLKAVHNKIVIAAIDGQLTVKKLFHRGGLIKLLPENSDYPEIELEQESDLVIWGVVIGSFRRFQSF